MQGLDVLNIGSLLCYIVHYVICNYLNCKWFIYTAWEPFRDFIPENERDSFITAYQKRLHSDNLETQVSVVLWFYRKDSSTLNTFLKNVF